MRKNQIKQIINEEFEKETPAMLGKIKDECKNTKQVESSLCFSSKDNRSFKYMFKKVSYVLLACTLFVGGILIGNIDMQVKVLAKETSIYLDVNPSIEIQIDENKNVLDCIAGNEDGEKILKYVQLDGVNINTALYAIVGAMYTNGYLSTEANSILVSLEDYEGNNVLLLDDISQQIENIFEKNESMECSIIAQKFEETEQLKEKAKEYKISVGKMLLIDKIISRNELYTNEEIEELASMSIHELDLIYQSMEHPKNEDEIIKGNPNGFIMEEEALSKILTHLDVLKDDVEWFEVITLYHKNDMQERKMVYLVSLILKDSDEKIKFIIDCNTGEILPEETVDEWKDKIPNDGHFGGPNDKEPPQDNHDNPIN